MTTSQVQRKWKRKLAIISRIGLETGWLSQAVFSSVCNNNWKRTLCEEAALLAKWWKYCSWKEKKENSSLFCTFLVSIETKLKLSLVEKDSVSWRGEVLRPPVLCSRVILLQYICMYTDIFIHRLWCWVFIRKCTKSNRGPNSNNRNGDIS